MQPYLYTYRSWMNRLRSTRWAPVGLSAIGTALTLWIAGCSTAPKETAQPPAPPAPVAVTPEAPPKIVSQATSEYAYRTDGAKHIYQQWGDKIYRGKMPPLLHAVGVLQVQLDARGNVTRVQWMRAPSHAPAVMNEIESMVRASAPFPAPVKIGAMTYTDTWLWDKSGRFQLDTLTEGQR